ncbi:MAG: symmetrical bis(5'-nucleosyl)-tetraphosphatase [Burkholderiales bacterium]
MATYAIGDVQGCFSALKRLLLKIGHRPAQDRLWFVGDLVNRGSESLATLRFVRDLGEQAVTVLGNHDLHLLTVAAGHTRAKAGDTLDDVLGAPDREELLGWLRQQPLMHREDGHVMVHAGLLPQWSTGEAMVLAAEVETALRGEDFSPFVKAMYGNEPHRWSSDLEGHTRLRVITNALTRLRVCTPAGAMDFSFKGPPEKAPSGLLPWFDIPGRKSAGETLIFGHWSALGFHMQENLIGLDSACLWGGKLTAVRLEDRALFQVDCHPS